MTRLTLTAAFLLLAFAPAAAQQDNEPPLPLPQSPGQLEDRLWCEGVAKCTDVPPVVNEEEKVDQEPNVEKPAPAEQLTDV
jgi:hypothetical protein